ncbi:MAG: thioredoxin fold domain-containing protein [Psittacicella sp.]
MKKIFLTIFLLSILIPAYASNALNSQNKNIENSGVENTISALNLTDVIITKSPFPNLYSIYSKQGTFYITKNGSYIIEGNLYKVSNKIITNVSGMYLMGILNELNKSAIEFKAPNQKYSITAFIDISCGYCKTFIQKINSYTSQGITVKLLPYPKEGLNSQEAYQMQYIWTSKHPHENLLAAFNGTNNFYVKEPLEIVKNSYFIANEYNIKYTPLLITSNGIIIPGSITPKKLLTILQGKI